MSICADAVCIDGEGPARSRRSPHGEAPMTQYLLSIYQPDGDPPPAPILEKIMKDVTAVDQEMKAAGAWVFTGRLHPASTATVVRGQGDNALLTDGPYVEGKEHVGGF